MMLLLPFLTQHANPTVSVPALTTPGSFTATAIGSSQINLSWSDTNTSPNETNFEIQRGLLADYSDAVIINYPVANAISYFNTGLTPETPYYYRLRAKGNGTTTSDSNWVTASATTTAASGIAPLRMKQYEDPGQGYMAWCKVLKYYLDGVYIIDYFGSSVTHHYGRSDIRKLRLDKFANKISDILFYDSGATRTESRRDLAGNTVVGPSGEQIGLAFYVQNGVEIPDIDHPEHDNEDQTTGSFLGLGYYRSTDGWETWTDYPDSFPHGPNTAYSICGNTIQHPVTGRIWKSAYGTLPPYRGIIGHSDDYGLTWTLTSLSPLINSDSENGLALLDPGTGNDDCIIGLFTRNDIDRMDFWMSFDGGASLTYYEQFAFASDKAKPPICFIRPDNGHLLVLYSDRSPYDYLIWAAEFDMDILKTGTAGCLAAALVKKMVLAESNINSLPFHSDNTPAQFGYPDIAWPLLEDGSPDPDTEPYVLFYDENQLSPNPGVDGHDICKVDTMVTPFEGDVWIKTRQTVSFLALPNGTTPISQTAASIDNWGAWINGDGATLTVPKDGHYRIAVNLPVSNGDGGTKVLNLVKNGTTTVCTITETDGLLSAVGSLRGTCEIDLVQGDTVHFAITVTGSDGSCQSAAGTTVLFGMFCGVDIICVRPIPDPITVEVASVSQHFANGVPTLIGGTEVTDTANCWDPTTKIFSIPKTGMYEFRVKQTLPNAPGGRRVFAIHNYAYGMEDQESVVKWLYHTEDKARGGTNTDTDIVWTCRLNRNESVKVWLTVYGADLDSVAGAYNSIEIEEV